MKTFYSAALTALFFLPLSYSEAKQTWSDTSIFNLKDEWKNQENKTFKIEDFKGKPTVIAMVYTTCQHTCPIITSKVVSIRESLLKKLQNKVQYSLISFDPEGDTPKVLSKYKKKRKLDKNWTLLTSDPRTVRQLAGVLGVNYKPMEGGGFSHSNIITLIDKNGVIVEQIKTLNADNKTMVKKLKGLLK